MKWKNFNVCFALIMISNMVSAQDKIQLKNKFNLPDSYVHFHFDYDSLQIDTLHMNTTISQINYTGYLKEVDSMLSDGEWFKFPEHKLRFLITTENGVLMYAHESFEDKTGKSFIKYENHPDLDLKIYESFREGGVGFQVRKKGSETIVNINGTEIVLNSTEDVNRFYHIKSDLSIQELSEFCGIPKQTFYSNRALKESYSVNGTGLKSGRYQRFSETGIIQESGSYIISNDKSLQNGVWTYFDELGVPVKVVWFESGSAKKTCKPKIK